MVAIYTTRANCTQREKHDVNHHHLHWNISDTIRTPTVGTIIGILWYSPPSPEIAAAKHCSYVPIMQVQHARKVLIVWFYYYFHSLVNY